MQDKRIVHRLIEEVWSQGQFSVVDELVASDYIGHSPSADTETHGTEGYKQFFAMLRTAFPDVQFTLDHELAEGSYVVARWTARGTHLGNFMGMPPTGKGAAVSGTTIYRIADGKVAECWTNADDLGLLRQIGALSLAGQPA
jgi:steroid delta-isomerase-like uncharacterized protein